MTTPKVTELPLRMEPTTVDDPFLTGQAPADPAEPDVYELDHRRNDGIEVRLLWNEVTDQVTVALADAKTGDAFEVAVASHEARDAFHHPYAYAASAGIRFGGAASAGE
jgi:hypothetical protein